MKLQEVFIQVGVTALRDPTGAFLPSEPIYKRVLVEQGKEHELTKDEKNLLRDVSGFFFDKCDKELEITSSGIKKKKSVNALAKQTDELGCTSIIQQENQK